MKLRGGFAWVLPLFAGALLAVGVGVVALGLQATLSRPSAGQQLAARVIGRLDAMHEARTSLTLDRYRGVPTVCMVAGGRDEIRIGSDLRLQIARVHVRRLSGPAEAPGQLAALAALSACPRFLANGLNARLAADRATLVGRTDLRGCPVDVFDVSNYPRQPVVQLLVKRRDLVPMEIRFFSHRLTGHGKIVVMSRKTAKNVSLYFLKQRAKL